MSGHSAQSNIWQKTKHKLLITTVKHGGGRIIIWACLAPWALCIEWTMNLSVLSKYSLTKCDWMQDSVIGQSDQQLKLDLYWAVQQDNCPEQTIKSPSEKEKESKRSNGPVNINQTQHPQTCCCSINVILNLLRLDLNYFRPK